VGGKNPGERYRITIWTLGGEDPVRVQSQVGRMVRLVAAIDAPTGLADQIGVEGVNQGRNDARRWNVIAMRELAPAISGSAENLAVTVVASVFLQQPDVGRGLGVDGIVHAKDLVRARPGEGIHELRVVLALPCWVRGVGKRKEVHDRLPSWVKPPRRNLVARERRAGKGIFNGNEHACGGER